MAIPPSYAVRVKVVEPASAPALNAEITAQNVAGYWMTEIRLIDAATAVLMFSQFPPGFPYPAPQKINELAPSQLVLDADIAAEELNGYLPTGLLISSAGSVFLIYSQIGYAP